MVGTKKWKKVRSQTKAIPLPSSSLTETSFFNSEEQQTFPHIAPFAPPPFKQYKKKKKKKFQNRQRRKCGCRKEKKERKNHNF